MFFTPPPLAMPPETGIVITLATPPATVIAQPAPQTLDASHNNIAPPEQLIAQQSNPIPIQPQISPQVLPQIPSQIPPQASPQVPPARNPNLPILDNPQSPKKLDIPDRLEERPILDTSALDFDRNFVSVGQYLAPTARISQLSILKRVLPEASILTHLMPRVGLRLPNLSFGGNGTRFMMYYPGSQPNASDPTLVSPATDIDLPPNALPTNAIALAPNANPNGSMNCIAEVEMVKKKRPDDRTESIYFTLQKCYEKQKANAQQLQQKTLEIYTLNNLATLSYVLGDYLKAIDYHQEQLKLAQAEKNTIAEGMALAGIGASHGALGDYQQAISFYNQALERLPEDTAPQWRSLVLRNLGNAALNQKDAIKAIDFQQQSLTVSRKINDLYGEAQAHGNLGNAYADRSDFAKSLESHQQSLTIAQTIKDPFQEAQALLGLGTTSGYQRNFTIAASYHQRSLKIMRELQAKLGEGITLTNLGDTLYRLQRFSEAETNLKDGVTVWESLRAGLGNNDAFKVSIFETQLSTYRNLQEALIAQNKTANALEISERSRARAFIELVARNRTNNLKSDSSSNLEINPQPLTIAQIQQTAIAQKSTLVQYSIIRDQFVETSHGGSVQFTTEPKETALFIWVVQPNGTVQFRRTALTPEMGVTDQSLVKLISNSRDAIGTRGSRSNASFNIGDRVRRKGEPTSWQPYQVVSIANGKANLSHPEIQLSEPVAIDELYAATSQNQQFSQFKALHNKLIAPIADLLPTDPNAKIVFIPQEQLFLVPFAALQNAKGEFLIEKHTLLTAPSIQLLGLRQSRRTAATNLIVGNPTPMPNNFAQLPGSEIEAQAVAQLLTTQALTTQAATETQIKSQLPQAKLIHLATHGFFDEQRPLQGAIALAPSPQDDGLLTAEEVLNMRLQADLVVLSACDTGRGKITGDGILGLSRSWLAAGANNVLVSLWAVNDQSTSTLMVNFYRSLQQQPNSQLGNASALRQAMLTTLKTNPSPKDWAAFTLIGSSN